MNSNDAPQQYVIIGSGVSGIAAAESIRTLDPSGKITLVSDDPAGYYSRPGLAYYLTGELNEDVLFPFSKKDFQALNLHWYAGQAAAIHPAQHQVLLGSGETIPYDRMLIATGSSAIPIKVPGAQLAGVVKLDHMADARAILKLARRARSAVVVGGGITALELVEGLRARGLKVHFFIRGERYWSGVLDPIESQIVEARLVHEGVKLHYHTELAEVMGHQNRVVGVRTSKGEQVACDMLAVAIGVRPRIDLAKAAGLTIERGILTNDRLQTSEADIFTAGDAAQVFDPFSGESVLDTLWSTARQQGSAAGINMTGQTAPYRKSVPYNVTRLAGLTTTIIGTVGGGADPSLTGINRGDSETWRHLPVHVVAETRSSQNRLRLLVGENRLLGAVVMGDQSVSGAVQNLIAQEIDISPIRDSLLNSSGIEKIIAGFWDQWRAANAAAWS